MPQYAIIFTANRVIERVTTDPTIQVGASLSIVGPLNPVIDIGHPPGTPGWKLDGANQKVPCTLQEWRDAAMDDAFNASENQRKYDELRQATIALRDDATVAQSVKTFAIKLLQTMR